VLAVLVIAAGSFVASLAGPTAYALTIDMGGRHVAAVFSVMNMSGNLGAVAFPKVVPWLKDLAGSWDLVLYVFAAVYVAAAICWIPFNPTKPIVSMED
jgi:ACS family glucarate transporter-like MFS transporter